MIFQMGKEKKNGMMEPNSKGILQMGLKTGGEYYDLVLMDQCMMDTLNRMNFKGKDS